MSVALAEGVFFDVKLPVRWRTQHTQSALEAHRYLTVLTEFESPNADADVGQSKLDLALIWLARSLAAPMPSDCVARIGLEAVQWQAEAALCSGQTGVVELCLSSSFPFLLQLPAKILTCVPAALGFDIKAQLLPMDDLLTEAYERMVFRYHRRQIQQFREEKH